MNVGEMLSEIEELRQKLESLVAAKGTTDHEVLVFSKMLDAVLNQYYRWLLNQEAGE